tara:strand:- start:1885 stop:2115 length:231 start_codon:yes stop_codon:yes gene_type:complete
MVGAFGMLCAKWATRLKVYNGMLEPLLVWVLEPLLMWVQRVLIAVSRGARGKRPPRDLGMATDTLYVYLLPLVSTI